ncbi:hypothetical protein ACXYMU_02565 [Pontibacter sp. CAU 1760]
MKNIIKLAVFTVFMYFFANQLLLDQPSSAEPAQPGTDIVTQESPSPDKHTEMSDTLYISQNQHISGI